MKKVLHISLLFLLVFNLHVKAQYRLLGARQAALGECGLAVADVWASSHNQAALALVKGYAAGVYYEDRFNLKELSLKAAAVLVPTAYGNIGVSFSSFGSEDYSEKKMGLALAKKLGPRLALAVQMDYFLVDQAVSYGNAMAFTTEIGILSSPVDGLTIGVHLFNPTKVKMNELGDQYLPQVGRLGAKYEVGRQLRIMAEVSKNITTNSVYRFGMEYDLLKNISLRYGYRSLYSANSFGLGVRFAHIMVDVAASQFAGLGWNTIMGLQFQISGTGLKAKTQE